MFKGEMFRGKVRVPAVVAGQHGYRSQSTTYAHTAFTAVTYCARYLMCITQSVVQKYTRNFLQTNAVDIPA